TWSEWWTYEGISGPQYWSLVNNDWLLCAKGKRQSPINIDPRELLYDPNLDKVKVDNHTMNGFLMNTGQHLKFQVATNVSPPMNWVNISGGPLAYKYMITDVYFHFGSTNNQGSDHAVDNITFPLEIQIMGYNTDLYGNVSHALESTNGIAIISLLGQIDKRSNTELDTLLKKVELIKEQGECINVENISIHGLLPNTENYVTYEGSIPFPGCQETVTWMIFNKPVYVNEESLKILREMIREDSINRTSVANNFRPLQMTHSRPVRTNINFSVSYFALSICIVFGVLFGGVFLIYVV
ncbi:hypothetical protein HELRODRAFT_76315, partial [Helobdella robusta]|uniref:Alpha-carbonic anhydrase domain-containing protein n=1 Tax=Helobdella robusta TaxID=6412 RepID=T1G2I2_HELRO